MSNNEYLSSFGVVRQYGRGEGRDELYEASAKPALGAHNCIEVVVDSKGPTPNFDGKYHRDGAKIPAGATVVGGYLIIEAKGSAANVKLDLVKKDGTDAKALLAAVAAPADNSANAFDGAAVGTVMAEDRYLKVGGTTTGLVAKAIVEFI